MKAFAYLRVSGKAQVEGDGFPRQRQAITTAATNLGFTIQKEFLDGGVSGTTSWEDRPAFSEMMSCALDMDEPVTIIVENLTRLAREFRVQDTILTVLAAKGIDLISADTGENITQAIKDDPSKEAMIQIYAVFSQLEKKSLVRKLRIARERKKELTGRCEGQKPYGHFSKEAATLKHMLDLRANNHTVRNISDLLNADPEHATTTRNGRPWTFGVVAKILARNTPDEEETTEFE